MVAISLVILLAFIPAILLANALASMFAPFSASMLAISVEFAFKVFLAFIFDFFALLLAVKAVDTSLVTNLNQ